MLDSSQALQDPISNVNMGFFPPPINNQFQI